MQMIKLKDFAHKWTYIMKNYKKSNIIQENEWVLLE